MLIIILYWLFFYRDILLDPHKYCNGEAIGLFLPVSRLCGESWRKGKIPSDPYFYADLTSEGAYHGIFYPVNIFVSIIGSYTSLKNHFSLMVYAQIAHNLLGAIGMYLLTGNVICGLLWGFGGHIMRPEHLWVQTLAWFPWVLMYGAIPLGMMILAGFVPIIALLSPILAYYSPSFTFLGLGIGLPLLWPMLSNMRRSVRGRLPLFGKSPKWSLLGFFAPIIPRTYINGVGFWEHSFYLTPIVLLSFHSTNVFLWIMLGLGVMGMLFGCKRWYGRVAVRGAVLVSACLILMLPNIMLLNIMALIPICLVGFMLLPNRSILPVVPFDKERYDLTQLPEIKGNTEYRTNNIPKPWVTGILHKVRSVGYVGSSSIYRFGLYRGGGCGSHNVMDSIQDRRLIDMLGVRWHYGRKPFYDWVRLKSDLWENPEAFPRQWVVRDYRVERCVDNILPRMLEVNLKQTVILEDEPKEKCFLVSNEVWTGKGYRGNLCFRVEGILEEEANDRQGISRL